MSKYSKDKLQEIDAQIARLLATYPNMSAREIAETLFLDHAFVCRRKNKIERANAETIRTMTVEQDLGGIMNFLNASLPVIAEIIFDEGEKDDLGIWVRHPASNRDKINAMRVSLAGKMMLLDKKFEVGIFERQIGKIKTEKNDLSPEQLALIERGFELMYGHAKPMEDGGGSLDESKIENNP
jgi:hypothetical protein